MEEQTQEKFEGYALVEIMGHQRVAGFVTTVAFGSTVMFKVVQDEMPAEEQVIEEDRWINGHRVYAGSRIRLSRRRAETLVGAASVYRMTRCTQDEAFRSQPIDIEVLERAERKALAVAADVDASIVGYDGDDEDGDS